LWSSIANPFAARHQDFTTGNLNRAILLLRIPMVLEYGAESLLPLVDVFWVGRFGADAVRHRRPLPNRSSAWSMAIGFGLSLSTTAMVVAASVKKIPLVPAVAGFKPSAIGLAVSALVGIPCVFYAPDLLASWAHPANRRRSAPATHASLRRQRRHPAALSQQRHLPGRWRRRHRHALLWVSKHHQSGPRPLPHFRLGTVPQLGVNGAALATFHRPQLGVLYQFYLDFSGLRAHPHPS